MKLRAGDLVEVKSKEEILSTLDGKGCLDNLPFMPEMFKYCGQRLRVYKRAHKTCDSIYYAGKRRLEGTVHLENARCDGRSHGDCQAECLMFWKEAWLRRVPAPSTHRGDMPVRASGCEETSVIAGVTKGFDPDTKEPIYACQATQLLEATTVLPWWDLRQYIEDYLSRNVGLKEILGVVSFATFDWITRQRHGGGRIKRLYNMIQKIRGKAGYVYTPGRLAHGSPTPVVNLNLQPGESVRVKKFEAILETIDDHNRNRGLVWSEEMVPYCGGTYRVKKRVQNIIDEKTGKMLRFKTESVILDGVVCLGKYGSCRYLCPRSTYPYWREVWLERTSHPGKENAGGELTHG